MTDIQTIADIQRLIVTGETDWRQYGEVTTQTEGDLTLFNYLPTAVFGGDWKPFEQISRGLILNRQTGEVVARPFDKFFNWLEGGRCTSAPVVSVAEKIDGSLGILYRANNRYWIATRGSMKSEQAEWATEFLRANYNLFNLKDEYTLLFEIVYPENRIVVNYGLREDLPLLAVRNRHTGAYLSAGETDELAAYYGFSRPQIYSLKTVEDIAILLHVLDANHEGFVAEFADGQRFKFKGDEYLTLHRLIASISYKNTLRAIADGTLQTFLDSLPDEFLSDVRRWQGEILAGVAEIKASVQEAFNEAPKGTRKDFALWVQKMVTRDRQPYLYAMLDGKPLEPMIYKALESRQDEKMLREDVDT